MRNLDRYWMALPGAALLAMTLAASIPALADGNQATASQQAHTHQFEQMQVRMQTMHTLMNQIHEATDPAARQKLMDQQYQLMREQMKDMGAMRGCMMGDGMAGHGMTGQGMMGQGMADHGMMQPGGQEKTD